MSINRPRKVKNGLTKVINKVKVRNKGFARHTYNGENKTLK